jgi:hypothetical protein
MTATTNETLTIFEIGQTYTTYETGTVVKVLSRSMNSLTIQLASGETLQKRFKLNDDGVEFLQLSKWETVYADDVCDEEPNKAASYDPLDHESKGLQARVDDISNQLSSLTQYKTEDSDDDDMFLFDLLDEMFAALTPPTNP